MHNILLEKTREVYLGGGGREGMKSLYVEDTYGTADATDAQLGSAVSPFKFVFKFLHFALFPNLCLLWSKTRHVRMNFTMGYFRGTIVAVEKKKKCYIF
jgi:hypothetical protein